jgi:hypothetical protein
MWWHWHKTKTLWLLGFIYWVSRHRYSKLYECNIWIMVIKLTYSNIPLMLDMGKRQFQDTLYWAIIHLVKVTLYFKKMAWRIIHVFQKYIFDRKNNFFFSSFQNVKQIYSSNSAMYEWMHWDTKCKNSNTKM